MKNREEVIHSLCVWHRNDYLIRKEITDPSWTAGMTEDDAKMLYKTMELIYSQYFEPIVRNHPNAFKTDKRSTRSHRNRR